MSRCRFESQRPTLVRNLLKVYRQAEPSDLADGLVWYPSARATVREWASHYRYSIDTVAAIVAALSPQVEWTRNLIIADDVLAGRNPSIGGVLHSNLRKAETLRDMDWQSDTHTLAERMLTASPRGPKVNSFAQNLAGDDTIVTVDTHAAQAALNNPLVSFGLPWTPYRIFAECYAIAATKVDRRPAEFQAIVWHVWKRLYPRTWKLQNRRQWHVIGMEEE